MNREPLVTIGMPVLNGERLLEGALDALLGQTYQNFELIISDNASDDSTESICRRYVDRDPRIRYDRLNERVPVQENFNRLLRMARGEYFCWAAFDDRWEPAFVGRLLELLINRPEAVLAFCRFDNVDAEGTVVKRYNDDWATVLQSSRFRQFSAFLLRDEPASQKANFIYGLMRTQAIVAAGGLPTHRRQFSGADIVALLRLLAQGPFVYADELLFHYRVRSLTVRRREPIGRYLLARTFGSMAGHSGNVMRYFSFNHEYHHSVRRFVRSEMPGSPFTRALLWLLVLLKEIWSPAIGIPKAVAKELGVTRQWS